MSLKLINQSSNRKTGAIATTYRAGSSMYGSCPASCSLNPDGDNSAKEIVISVKKLLLKNLSLMCFVIIVEKIYLDF